MMVKLPTFSEGPFAANQLIKGCIYSCRCLPAWDARSWELRPAAGAGTPSDLDSHLTFTCRSLPLAADRPCRRGRPVCRAGPGSQLRCPCHGHGLPVLPREQARSRLCAAGSHPPLRHGAPPPALGPSAEDLPKQDGVLAGARGRHQPRHQVCGARSGGPGGDRGGTHRGGKASASTPERRVFCPLCFSLGVPLRCSLTALPAICLSGAHSP